jgi:hypothetical protein
LGLKITSNGHFLPWRDDYTTLMFSIKNSLARAGLGSLPMALIKGLSIRVIPALLYGCEIWCISWLAKVFKGIESPYKHPRLKIVLDFIKSYLGLPKNSFTAVIFKLVNLPSML